MQWTVLNSAISLMGYWVAAYCVDKKWYGRRRMQVRFSPGRERHWQVAAPRAAPASAVGSKCVQSPTPHTHTTEHEPRCPPQTFGFLMMFVLFLICGAGYNVLTASKAGYMGFQVGGGG